MDPIAQHNVFKLFHVQSSPFSCLLNFFSIYIHQRERKKYIHVQKLYEDQGN